MTNVCTGEILPVVFLFYTLEVKLLFITYPKYYTCGEIHYAIIS